MPELRAVPFNLVNVDQTLAQRVADGLGMALPKASTAAVAATDMEPSPALRIIGKYPQTLKGRSVGILVSDGADGALVAAVKSAVETEGRNGQDRRAQDRWRGTQGRQDAEGRWAACSPSVIFDAVAIILSEAGCQMLMKEGAAIDFAKDAFGHLKAIGHSAEAKPLLDKAGVQADDGIVVLGKSVEAFLAPARTRQWVREPNVRMLA